MEAYRQVLEEDPHNLDVRGYVIALGLKTGAWSEAVHQHMKCAEIFHLRGVLSEAAERCREVLRLAAAAREPSGPCALDERARVKEAVKRVKPDVCFYIGSYFLQCQNLEQAVRYLRRSIELGPGRWEPHLLLGKACMMLSRDKEAIAHLQEVMRFAPLEAAPAYEMLGEIFARTGRSVEKNVVWFFHAAEGYFKKNLLSDAVRVYHRILEFDPENRGAIEALRELE